MLELFARAFNLGLLATILPGHLQTLAVNSALAYGWRKSVVIAAAPFISDLPIIVVVLFALRQFPPAFLSAMRLAGGCFLLYLAFSAYRVYRTGAAPSGDDGAVEVRPWSILRSALLINLISPAPYLFWGTLHGPAVLGAVDDYGWGAALVYIALFYITFFLGFVLIILAFDRMRGLNARVVRGITLLTVVALAFFGISLLVQGVQELLPHFSIGQGSVH